VPKTSNRSVIQEAGAFPRKHDEACRVNQIARMSPSAMIAADASSLTLAWIVCILLLQLMGRPSPIGGVVRFLVAVPFTLVIFGLSGLYKACRIEPSDEVKAVVICITGVQAGCAGAFWRLQTSGELSPAIALASLSLVLVPIGRL